MLLKLKPFGSIHQILKQLWYKKMCILCVEFEKGKLTLQETLRNLNEMLSTLEEEHINEIVKMLEDFKKNNNKDIKHV